LEKVKAGIENYHRLQALFSDLLKQEEEKVLSSERAIGTEGKKNFRRRFRRP
jgi:hypothetical protein